MKDRMGLPDPLDDDFRRLEREVRRRKCEHPDWVDVTSMGGMERRKMCIKCGYAVRETWVT